MEEAELREALASGEKLDEIIVKASVSREFLEKVVTFLDDDLWIAQKNALKVIMAVQELPPGFYDALINKLVAMILKSEAVPLTQEIARAFGELSVRHPEKVSKAIPVIFANYRIGDPKVKVNMAYVLEEIMRANPKLLGNVFRDISYMLCSKESADKLTALNFISALGENGLRYVTPFLPKIFMLLHDGDEVVRASTVEVLVQMASVNPKLKKIIISKLEESQDDRSPLVKRKIEEGLLTLRLYRE
ncbi:PH0542 domain-containing protein [Thermococcus sp. 21S7]|uniref:PH0542 domain-containing protein n=1 Tax=Thermococcus sp. 21S7 TaxID=1638221 RepID=UPI0014399BD1|nr:PH0542 domain-containing protein [Thermococcus sp. 21S7]NJE62584.1 hypothetical protein [Thermococcus sp. 21S7]